MHELNNNLTKEEFEEKETIRPIGDYSYTILIHGFNEYMIIKKEKIDVID